MVRVGDGPSVCHSVGDNIGRYYERLVVRIGDGHVCHSVGDIIGQYYERSVVRIEDGH